MIGKNLKYYRLSAGLSQEELAKKLGITKMSISNYENDKRDVDSQMLIKIADVLKIKATNLLRIDSFPLAITYGPFRKKANVSKEKQDLLYETIHRKLVNFHEVIVILGGMMMTTIDIHSKEKFINPDDAANKIREFLGFSKLGPVGNITDIIENKGIFIIEVKLKDNWFSGMNGTVNEVPYIVINKNMPVERQRFTLIHELAHILFTFKKGIDEEKIIDCIAGSFFFPREDVIRELGTYRTDIRFDLRCLQREYGISMQSVLLRAKQCNVITENVYLKHIKWLSKQGLRKDEKSNLKEENSDFFIKLVNRAVTEGFINENKASELLEYPYCSEVIQ